MSVASSSTRSDPIGCRRTGPWVVLAACLVWLGMPSPSAWPQADAVSPAESPPDDARSSGEDSGVFLPSDRGKERRLDRATRLLDAGEWTDAVATLDEILADEQDAFVLKASGDGTRRSIRAEAGRLIGSLPPAGRDAYALLCRSRADRALADAVRRDDASGVMAVARRWFDTPAGRRAAVIAAQAALEADDPCTAAAWLERLAAGGDAATRPVLTLMRAAAAARAGDRATAERLADDARRTAAAGGRVGGRELAASGGRPNHDWLDRFAPHAVREPAGNWLLVRGNAARNAVVAATEPLLVPRYRVPLTRHPEESRLLEKRRRALAADGGFAVPASAPLAVGETLVMQTPLGILGIDFETGKRVWIQSAAAARGTVVEAALGRGFDDATSGGLASDGVRVFAVESHPDALTPPAEPAGGIGPDAAGDRWAGGNLLTAYDVTARGTMAWRLPGQERPADAARDWFLGAPLVVGRDLFVLVESNGQVRLDVLDAADGRVQWSQPLADLEERQSAASPDGYARRLAGLTPALDQGVLVCPIGGGTVVAIDLTSRALLWAHGYRLAAGRAEELGGVRLRGLTGELSEPIGGRGGDPWPVIDSGRVYLMPYDADGLVCLHLRDGSAAWQRPLRGRRQIVGVVGGSLILQGADGVEAVAADTGRQRWARPHAGMRPSGRGLVTASRLFLPVDSPGILEIDLDGGTLLAHHAVRGGGIPGNLIAVRGEVISRGIDMLDVFHQTAELESRIESARRVDVRRPWADSWRGQLELTGGAVGPALERIRGTAAPARAAPTAAADALLFAMRRDFAAAAAAWRSWDDGGDAAAAIPDVLRSVVDGSLRQQDDATAWRACRRLAAVPAAAPRSALISDPSELGLEVDPDRWTLGRLTDLAGRGDASLRGQVAELVERLRAHDLDPATAPVAAADDPAAEEWPLGLVVARRSVRSPSDPGGLGGQVVGVPLVGADASIVPGIAIAYDMQQRKLLVTDGYGRRVVEPLPLEPAAALPWLNQISPIEPSVVGRTLVVRTAAGVSAFDLGAAAGENRLLWKTASRSPSGRDLVSVRAAVVGGRVARDGGLPLGRRVTEPDDLEGPRGTLAPPARRAGVLVPAARAAALLDPLTGRVLWERQGLPAIAEWIADDEIACGCTTDGRSSPVVSMGDGRLLHLVDLPGRRQRLASHGRHLVAVVPNDDGPLAARVRIDRIDPLTKESRPLGEFPGESRAAVVGDGRLAVFEPGGALGMIDIATGSTAWRTRLTGAATGVDQLHVMAWRDRYLVFAASADLAADGESPPIASLAGGVAAGGATPPLSGAIWALARDDGRPLWQAAATVRQHCLLLAQPDDLPVLVLTRQTRGDDGGRPELAVLCLDKRTGHAVLDEHRLTLQQHLFVGCEVSGAPREHTITIRGAGGMSPTVTLVFTGDPLPPQPPFQAEGRPPAAGRGLEALRRPAPPDEGR